MFGGTPCIFRCICIKRQAPFQKQKVRQPKSPHRKTQTPIVAKQIEGIGILHTISLGVRIFAEIHIAYGAQKKGIISPINKNTPFKYSICLASKL